jgi:hypothetical protein
MLASGKGPSEAANALDIGPSSAHGIMRERGLKKQPAAYAQVDEN